MTTATIILGLLLSFSCTNNAEDTVSAGGCVNTTDCPDGSVCLGETCKVAECFDSIECGMEEYCNAAFSCSSGCQADSDCTAGTECDTSTETCVEYGCRETDLDCNYGEICDTTSGECIADSRDHCQSCYILDSNSCASNSECVAFAGKSCQSTADCEQGEFCDLFADGRFCHADYCMVRCNPNGEDDAPRGFTCGDIYGNGSLYAYYGDCEWLLDNGL